MPTWKCAWFSTTDPDHECGAEATHVIDAKEAGVIERYGACADHVDRMAVTGEFHAVVKVGALTAWDRDEHDPCERSTTGCSVAHGVAGLDSECATW